MVGVGANARREARLCAPFFVGSKLRERQIVCCEKCVWCGLCVENVGATL